MLILGIETSCDETAASLVKDGREIISNIVSSSLPIHQQTGGIIPETAAREQLKYIIPVIEEAIKGVKPEEIGAIAVTTGPGLIGSLLVGIETAKTFAYVWKKPIIPVNHLIGHIYANFINVTSKPSEIIFPAISLIVSGGHTELILIKKHGDLKFLGGTRDDAAGEAFDKISRILELGYPGGPAIQKKAEEYLTIGAVKKEAFLPRPMINSGDFDFSFSGLKTALFNLVQEKKQGGKKILTEEEKSLIANETQEAITDVLVKKTIEAGEKYKVKTIMIAGGVAANKRLREKLREKNQNKFLLSFPPVSLCTDNAAAIASAGYFNYFPAKIQEITVDPGLTIEE